MAVSNFSKARAIPTRSTTKKSAPTTTNFAKGIFTYKPNDTMDLDEVYLAQNARFDRIGEYKTRRGLKPICQPVGKSKLADTYTSNYTMVDADKATLTFTTYDIIYSIHLTIAAANATDYGVVQVSLFDKDDNLVATSCAQDIPTTPTDTEFVFINGPQLNYAQNPYTLKIGTQGLGKQKFKVACANGTTTPMYQRYLATPGRVIGSFEADIDGTKTILFAFKYGHSPAELAVLERLAPDGTITNIRQLPGGTQRVRFSQNGNKIRYTTGLEVPHLIDPTDWTDTAIETRDLKTDVDLQIKTSNIMTGNQQNLFYFSADTSTMALWTYPYNTQYAPEPDYTTTASINAYVPGSTTTTTIQSSTLTPTWESHGVSDIGIGDLIEDDNGNFGKVTTISGTSITVMSVLNPAVTIESYDKFGSNFYTNFPATDTGDPLTAMFILGGVYYFLTRRNKYYLYLQTVEVWSQQSSSAQHGTFSQESCVCDLNYAYYATDDGVYVFDGSSEASITEKSIQKTYDAIKGKESICLELYNNRLYVFYSSKGNGINDSCLVYNINLRLWESFDTGLYVSSTIGRQSPSNRFICGSNRFGQLFSFEDDNNDYADVGAPIDFDLETAYLHFGTPSQLHRITKWRPEFATVDGDYSIKCGYALDFTDDVKYAYSINLKNKTILHENYVWDNPPNYGNIVTPTKLTTIPQVNGQFYRCQFRYQHHAAFEPVNFKAHTVAVETQRLR